MYKSSHVIILEADSSLLHGVPASEDVCTDTRKSTRPESEISENSHEANQSEARNRLYSTVQQTPDRTRSGMKPFCTF